VLRAVEVKKAPLLDRLGGPESIKAAVDVFYAKVGCQTSSAAVQQQLDEVMLWLQAG
jgi:truncated hemoglobin YjbI